MILFLWYYLHACLTLGVAPLPVVISELPVWAKLCNSCEVRQVLISPELVEYGDVRFTRIVAEHEACHQFLGHDRAWSVNPFASSTSEAEEEARTCTEEKFWTSRETEEQIAAAARQWIGEREARK